jgi:ATP-dependent Clp protease ATP-binding subunit ClpC
VEKLDYPILLYQTTPSSVLGILVGTDFRTVGLTEEAVIQEMTDYLQREYKKNDWYPWIDLFNYKFKHLSIPVRPMVEDGMGTYPWPYEIRVPVSAVYGASEEESQYICYLPLLDEEFYYFKSNQVQPLLKHLAQNALMQRSPKELFRISQYPEPKLERISLRINQARTAKSGPASGLTQYPKLERIAERFPPSRADSKLRRDRSKQVWQREDEITLLMDRIIVQRANILLVGAPGVGKSAILAQSIRRIENMARRYQSPFTFWRIQPQRITASSKYLGEWQQSVQELILQLRLANGILWVESVLQMASTGGSGPEDSVASFMYPYLLRGDLQMIGEITPSQLDRLRRLVPDFTSIFQIVEIAPFGELDTIRVMEKYAAQIAKQQKIKINSDSIVYLYRLLDRYRPEQQFPGKGIQFLSQLVHWSTDQGKKTINRTDIISRFSRTTGLPEVFLRDDVLLDQNALRSYFGNRIIGQKEAIEHLIQIVKVYKAGLNNPNKPITTLLFAGPTGVGKTATARALADYFFGQGQRQSPLVRIDMSEFRFAFQLARLIGDDHSSGQLVREMRGRSFAVLLLDEVEKANPVILDALLGLLDEGRMTDASGKVIHFQNSIVILTTNLGAGKQQTIGFNETNSSGVKYNSAIRAHFRPEFLNRIDQMVVFHALQKDSVKEIARLEMKAFAKRAGLTKRKLELEVTKSLLNYLAERGFDPRYGARPLQRTIDQEVGKAISEWMSRFPRKKNGILQISYRDKHIRCIFKSSPEQPKSKVS